MNLNERIQEILVELKEDYHVIGIKIEFEAEGALIDEAFRLKNLTLQSGLPLNIKIGGCEAVMDMLESLNIGVKGLVAPMVESSYALKKYLDAVNIVFSQREDVEFLINIETITAVNNFDEMLALPNIQVLDGIVIGRSDLSGSLGLKSSEVNSPKLLEICQEVTAKAKSRGLKVMMGGNVGLASIPFFKSLPIENLDAFETRKVIFKWPDCLENIEIGLQKAIEFEIAWLQVNSNYYQLLKSRDDDRINTLKQRQNFSHF